MHVRACLVFLHHQLFYIYHEWRGIPHLQLPVLSPTASCLMCEKRPSGLIQGFLPNSLYRRKSWKKNSDLSSAQWVCSPAFLERYTVSLPLCPPWSPSFYCKLTWAECWIRPISLSSNADPMTPARLVNFCAGWVTSGLFQRQNVTYHTRMCRWGSRILVFSLGKRTRVSIRKKSGWMGGISSLGIKQWQDRSSHSSFMKVVISWFVQPTGDRVKVIWLYLYCRQNKLL